MRFPVHLITACVIFCSSVAMAQEARMGSAKHECPPPIDLVPPNNKFPKSDAAIRKYAASNVWKIEIPTKTEAGRSAPQSLRLIVPTPFTSNGFFLSDSVLPTDPESSIYRFKYIDISAGMFKPLAASPQFPIKYLEVDWNTEGLPRGPNGSFITPHYDFHFYFRDCKWVMEHMTCMTTGKTCDPQKSGHDTMRPFLQLPPDSFLPASYFPDVDSSIVYMGLHNLDGKFTYEVQNVNHNPVIIYGSFENELAFLEVSMTLYAFQDAVRRSEKGEKPLSWNIAQPADYAFPWWPTEVSLSHLPESKSFAFDFNGFKFRKVTAKPGND